MRRYQGRAALSTWLVVVSRGKALDRVRHLRGRRDIPDGIARLASPDQQVFELYHRRRLDLDQVREQLSAHGHEFSRQEVLEAIVRIESIVDRSTLRRLAYARAVTTRAVSSRLLEFLDEYRQETERAQIDQTPQQELLEREARETALRIRELIERLPAPERAALSLHVLEGQTARQVASVLGFVGQRRVYTVVESALRRLRAWLRMEETLDR